MKFQYLLIYNRILVEQMINSNSKIKGFSFIIALTSLPVYFLPLETASALFALDTVVSLHSLLPKTFMRIQ